MCWQEPWESQLRDRPQLWITFDDGDRLCLDGLDPVDRAELPAIARALGGTGEIERIGQLRTADAPQPF
ncbi:hypothetical protein [Nocardioides alcanivorans]|uniref:hypothetical protein n=1 Tax=Nocardioides alcanivorans TaxID=2897352 RepID=UPI001F3D344F|nr:hypothetical protein [Nocardioides alcanivorans]